VVEQPFTPSDSFDLAIGAAVSVQLVTVQEARDAVLLSRRVLESAMQ
jgi:hypothetical protein